MGYIVHVTGKERHRPDGLSFCDDVLLLAGKMATAETQVLRATGGTMGEKTLRGNCTDY